MAKRKIGYLTPGQATECIRAKFRPELTVHWTQHAKEQMELRDLIMSDVLHVLKNGFIYDEGESATRTGLFRYRMECTTPNSGGRTVIVVVIPSSSCELKIVTVMWKDNDTRTS